MKYVVICSMMLLLGAGVSAEEYVIGEYYAPYGVCTNVETTAVETVRDMPYRSYEPVEEEYPVYYSRPYYPVAAGYVRPACYRMPRYRYPARYYHCWPWRSRRGYWRNRRDYRHWCRDLRRCLRRCRD